MKRIHRTLALLLAALLLLGALPATALAATKVENLKKGHWYNLWNAIDRTVYYRFTLYSDSIVKISCRNVRDWAGFSLCTGPTHNKSIGELSVYDGKSTSCAALPKGTYYFSMSYEVERESGDPTPQACVTVEKAVNKPNYSKGKAIALAANKTVRIAQTANNSYSRWYKLRLNRTMPVTIKAQYGYTDSIVLYNSASAKVKCSRTYNRVKSKSSLKPGTYYIEVKVPREYDESTGFYQTGYSKRMGHFITVQWS